ncbi:MAG: DNA repair ATPase [Pirellulales bacterium]|nr:DNA repair ATPase [Pirellulales bacterium]
MSNTSDINDEKQQPTAEETPQGDTTTAPAGLEHGTYEVIRNRLNAAGKELRSRVEQLNSARKDVFGAIETKLLATERVTTDNNCIPRDMTPVGNCFLFGYNVHIGLRSIMNVEDVFSVYKFEDGLFTPQGLDLIEDDQFRRDFAELFKYYKNTVFTRFAVIGPHLFMVFRIGKDVRDIKTFKWLIDGERLVYMDARSEHEYLFPPQHEFTWQRTHRDMQSAGLHPHISIEDRLFVETVGGDLTVKIEDNTDTGEGIYAEDVDDPDQTLDDAEFFYAIVGSLILLKIRPYQEEKYRYLVYCEKTQSVRRLDTIENACVLLPDEHGVIFSNGYFLQTGESKVFDNPDLVDMAFSERIQSPNGEDYLYVFYNRKTGVHVLLPYNLIEQRVNTPVICSGYSLFKDGQMVFFKAQEEPQRHHALQIWQTPYVGADYQSPIQTDSFLYKIGNRDIVRGMAECHEVLGLIAKEDTYTNLFIDLSKKTGDILDAYYWLGDETTFNLRETLEKIKSAAEAAISEFEKVTSVRRNTRNELRRVSDKTREISATVHSRRFEVIGDFVGSLVELRGVRGEIISLRELRYIDMAEVDRLEESVQEQTQRVATNCVGFLLKPESLEPYAATVSKNRGAIDTLETVADSRKLEEQIAKNAGELEMLIEVVSNLKIEDATQRTTIIDNISAIFSQLNQARAALKTHMGELMKVEGVAEFTSQIKLLNQGVVNYLDICDTPDRCDEFLTKMMVQLEELEGRFAEFDEFVEKLAETREEIYNAFETRKLQLVEAHNKRATALMNAAERILKGIKGRVDKFGTVNEINGYFASDLMIEKVREIIDDLGEMGDSVKVDDIQSRMKTIREDAVRQLKDRQDLYEDGENVIRLGNHKFSVNNQAFDLTTVYRDEQMQFHLSGTNYFAPIEDEEFLATRNVWSQEVVSENKDVYRAEYLAYKIFQSLDSDGQPTAAEIQQMDDEALVAFVQRFMGPRYSEAYVKGVHDNDAAKIVRVLVELDATLGLLRYHPRARALALVFWSQFADAAEKELIAAQLRSFGRVEDLFPNAREQVRYIAEAEKLIGEYVSETKIFDAHLVPEAARYLFDELTHGDRFVVSARARNLYQAFEAYLSQKFFAEKYSEAVAGLDGNAAAAFLARRDWVTAFVASRGDDTETDYIDEVAALLMEESLDVTRVVEASVAQDLDNMIGNHPLIENKIYHLNYNTFMLKLARFEREVVPRFESYGHLKKELVDAERDRMRLDEFRPRVLTSFVRNKLIDQVYLKLLGDNLAKQIGVVGEKKRTDLMGLLLLISPPGYGKTTLMEYLANRLGIIFMKINGPALGHRVTSLDPKEAPNAAAREEMEKLNLAFEMGDNVMIYLDDIQHCNPEFLQKFISLCDAQRKIEGVYRGKTRTYDLRGKKVCVVMAGNPYTESGEKFKIPDMLANRADTYNLGEIIGDTADVFEMSYLENSLTSNPVLDRLASRSQKDVYAVMKMAEGETGEAVDLEGNYSVAEVDEMVAVMKKLMHVRDVVLKVNNEYIRSAGMTDEYRTEPAFKLQGSYRNMNRIASQVVAVMNDAELNALILASYQNDAQTLTTGSESNMLKFKELTGRLSSEELERWEDIKRRFGRNVQLKGIGDDAKFGQLVVQLSSFSDGLDSIKKTLRNGVEQMLLAKQADEKPITAAFDAGTTAAINALVEQLSAAKEEIRQSIARAADLRAAEPAAVEQEPAPQEIHVVSKIPNAVLNVMRHQFRLMEGWLEPLQKQSLKQGDDLHKLRETMAATLEKYNTLVEMLEQSAHEKDAIEDALAKHKIKVDRSK